MKRLLIFVLSFLLILALSAFLPVHGEEKIYDSVIRLHVIANSDSDYDQSVKLAVRDGIIALDLFSADTETLEDAAALIEGNEELLCECADGVLESLGAEYISRIEWGTERYPTRIYDGITYPAGTYRSLRIILGQGEGRNWWCVLFPPLCTSKAVADDSLDINADAKKTFSSSETKYVIRLKILEWLS